MADTLETPQTQTQNAQNAQNDQVNLSGRETEKLAAYKEYQSKKAAKALDNNYISDKFLNVELALLDESDSNKLTFNREKELKIACHFVPKIYKTSELYNPDGVIDIKYSFIEELVLEDKQDAIGLSGYAIIKNEGNVLEGVFERHNNYYFVVNITEYTKCGSLKYEPYIFELVAADDVSNPYKKDKKVRIRFIDVITSILKSHSIASFIKFESTEVTETKTYKELFSKIINYVKRYIRINNNNVYEFKKDVIYDQNMMFKGREKLNGHDADLDLSKLVKASFNKIDRNASIYEALQVFLVDCVTSIKMSDELKQVFEEMGDVLIPFFFKEEYADVNAIYYNLWHDQEEQDSGGTDRQPQQPAPQNPSTSTPPAQSAPQNPPTPTTNTPATIDESQETTGNSQNTDSLDTPPPTQVANTTPAVQGDKKGKETQESDKKISNFKDVSIRNYGGKSLGLILRNITMRDFFMPFYLCFTYAEKGGPFVWEDINPKSFINTLNGKSNESLQSLIFSAIDKNVVDKIWKNAVFLDASSSTSGSNCTLVFFDWFYKFFLKTFLNSSMMGGKNRYISNVIPDFYVFAGANKIGYADNANDSTFDNLFDEYNSYTVALSSGDTLNESLRAMGKNIASLVLVNDSYTFSLKGNLLRRPNEIMRLNVDIMDGGDQQLNVFTRDTSLYVYVRQVIHVFKGTTYTNNIVASKICESV